MSTAIIAVADTHVAIWYLFGDARLSKSADVFLQNAEHQGEHVGLSSITFIEMVYLIEKGRIPAEGMSRLARIVAEPANLFIEIPVSLAVGRAMARVDAVRIPDMPDRIIAATAQLMNAPIISRDGKIQLSGLAAKRRGLHLNTPHIIQSSIASADSVHNWAERRSVHYRVRIDLPTEQNRMVVTYSL